jgi:hypothetical protein
MGFAMPTKIKDFKWFVLLLLTTKNDCLPNLFLFGNEDAQQVLI